MTDVMLDIETLGTVPGCMVLSVGACTFNLATGEVGEEFYHSIQLTPQEIEGLHIEAETLAWWLSQGEVAREHAFAQETHPSQVAHAFRSWFSYVGGINIWAQGMDFDMPIFGEFLRRFNTTPPWKFYNCRDTRTLYDLANYRSNFNYKADVPREGVYHSAIDDCRHQVKCCAEAWRRL